MERISGYIASKISQNKTIHTISFLRHVCMCVYVSIIYIQLFLPQSISSHKLSVCKRCLNGTHCVVFSILTSSISEYFIILS